MSVYVFNNVVEFCTDSLRIAKKAAPYDAFLLNPPTARCFIILLEAAGEPVSRDGLLYAGWGVSGQVVTENSLNQAITQIRKTLKTAGLEQEFILTVSRVGYKISRAVKIEFKAEDEESHPERKSTLQDDEDFGVEHVIPSEPDKDIKQKSSFPNSLWVKVKQHKFTISLVSMVTCSFIVFSLTHSLLLGELFATPHTVNYIPYDTFMKDISVFYSSDIKNRDDYIQASQKHLEHDPFLARKLKENAGIKNIYMNGAIRNDIFNYFFCQGDIKFQPETCIAYTSVTEGVND